MPLVSFELDQDVIDRIKALNPNTPLEDFVRLSVILELMAEEKIKKDMESSKQKTWELLMQATGGKFDLNKMLPEDYPYADDIPDSEKPRVGEKFCLAGDKPE